VEDLQGLERGPLRSWLELAVLGLFAGPYAEEKFTEV
jgi:hypothetical protein